MPTFIPRGLLRPVPHLAMKGLLLALATLSLLAGCGGRSAPSNPGLPALGKAPAFALTSQNNTAVSMADLQGRVLLVNFIYTSCTDICPVLTARMAQMQTRLLADGLDEQVRLVSISVDPAWDTPERLRDYAGQYRANAALWHFLTGPPEDVRRVVVEGFKLGLSGPEPHTGHGSQRLVAHSDRSVLVGPNGTIRAYYRAEEWDADRVMADIRSLLP